MRADATLESIFQQDIITQMQSHGWHAGSAQNYNREKALYPQDVLDFVQKTQQPEWQKFKTIFPNDTERHFLDTVVAQLKKANSNATDIESRSYGTLGVLRHGLKTRGTRFSFCQFKPEHGLNPELHENYKQNICRVVPEVVYSPHATKAELEATGKQAKKWRIDLVLFINGFPVATLELKSEFKQAVQNAMAQYKKTRLPKDPETNKPEPLLTFKRGALVHFAVSQYDVYMATHLNGDDTYFLPFNKGTKEQGAGNDVPEDINEYATGYLWNEVLTPDSLLNIIGNFIHLQIEEKEDWEGRKYKKESLIFPRYHQWKVVTKLVEDSLTEGTGQKYLIQHSAGSGKSNSIAWTAHQLSSLYDASHKKMFDSVIVVTDRTVLDDQLQDTIYQFEHASGVVGRINNKEGDGSKSEKLAKALEMAQPIIIVTIQTFPYVLRAIENSSRLKERHYAVIADEAHSSQSGSTARQLKETLMLDERNEDDELSAEDVIDSVMASRKGSQNLSFYAFTATPKDKTLQLFGRLPNPTLPASKTNKPEAYHVYSMRQAIEEGFILDVLKNYTNYKVIYKLKQKVEEKDDQVDAKKAKIKLNQWVRLHDHNISQKVRIIIEHFKKNVMGLLGGQAKAMVVTSSRKEAVRYKQAFDKYVTEQNYANIQAMVAFSGEVKFTEHDADSTHLMGHKFTESNTNPNLKGRDMRKAFNSDDFQVMIVANKFQTGFDQPKLCAMYVDKKLGGVECVQTLSRLNRTYPGKAESGTFVLDFFNEPEEILNAFQPYYQTAELADVSNPDIVYDLAEKLKAAHIFLMAEVEQFVEAFYRKNKSSAALSNICKPAKQRWQQRYKQALDDYKVTKERLEIAKRTEEPVLIANAEKEFSEAKKARETLEIFRKDLGSFTRFYEFMSQIVEYNDKELEKMSLFARSLRPLLREQGTDEEEIDLSNVSMSHYRLSKIRQQDIQLKTNSTEHKIEPANDVGSAKAKDKTEDFLSVILQRVNDVFITDKLTDQDMINYVHTVAGKMSENARMMKQIKENPRQLAMLGEFDDALGNAVFDSNTAHTEQMTQLISDPAKMKQFANIIYDVLLSKG
ncbi:type I restriction endonuclease subunit R [Acinetobacter pollinis]|uniref:type I restriction endonuclease subunit R n=1 Tax=Acinetobacter pollinis TaxID=2605270 RepID=UPI0018C27422|nr:DEAD/DEAH box helicase family protein [Acinetobacter pollinis]MBF7693271.1 type I restriction endonuclease subunit R [Acinetobacter pollinis]MBF7699430.1 type I restriction endonuclease subunit R [Acinetobacter pollinis]